MRIESVLTGKFETYKDKTFYPHLSESNRALIQRLSLAYRFTFQELRQVSQTARDFEMWQEPNLDEFWDELEKSAPQNLTGPQRKHYLLKEFSRQVSEIKAAAKSYSAVPLDSPKRQPLKITKEETDKDIFGNCPVASPKTVCCNLKTIDAVENCAFGCSYCTIQTFYGDRVVFDSRLKEKLKNIQLDPKRFYHIGTGQSSDSLVWGNREGILDNLCDFARAHPNILLEFKTKSDHVSYFLDHEIPRNVVCSWSLNTDTIVENEEHFTASLTRRLEAARKAADHGVKVAFHFHPIVYYEGWKEEYQDLAGKVQKMFQTDEVLFISFGSVTFIKPVIQEIRKRGGHTKILQMDLVPDP
ncbi:MAG: hypothetical protein HY585_05655, partial [Candidatus Omnitrophica bacterium]|nr:hypothetical protein [Candidatus Omnitrophota bacterium]